MGGLAGGAGAGSEVICGWAAHPHDPLPDGEGRMCFIYSELQIPKVSKTFRVCFGTASKLYKVLNLRKALFNSI